MSLNESLHESMREQNENDYDFLMPKRRKAENFSGGKANLSTGT